MPSIPFRYIEPFSRNFDNVLYKLILLSSRFISTLRDAMANVGLFECKLNLASHEKGGHTLRKHIMTPDDLLLNQSNSTEFLSAYLSKEIAEFWIQAAIDLNKKYIVALYQISQGFQQNAIYLLYLRSLSRLRC